MPTTYQSPVHTFSIDDIVGTFSGVTYASDPTLIDTTGLVIPQITDKDGNVLSGIDSEFGFYVTDFLGAEQKVLDGDYAEGHAGNILDPSDPSTVVGISIKNAVTDFFRSGLPLGTWALGLGGATVKASTEHYVTMADLLSDQLYPDDESALRTLDNDLRLLDRVLNESSSELEAGVKHELYVEELVEALQRGIDNNEAGTNPQVYSDLDFDRDGTADTFTTRSVSIDYDADGDGIVETISVGGIDLDNDGTADIIDSQLNGIGGEADLVDLLEPNEASVTSDIAYSTDYSVTLKDDGKLLYRWGTAVKRPNDARMEVDLDLPTDWTEDLDVNGIPDVLEGDGLGFVVKKAQLVITHDVTNNPNDQVRPEDYENEGAIGRLPSYYVIRDPDDPSNKLWVSPVDTYNGEGEFLPSYFKLGADGEVDLGAGGVAVYDPDGALVGYRNTDSDNNLIGTVLRDYALAAQNDAADLSFSSADIEAGFTAAWYTTTDREPFEWSYDKFSDDQYRQVFESFRSPEDAALEGYTENDLVSGPRWRLTPNKFGQDLPGLEVPLEPNSKPPFQKDNIKYETGTLTTTVLNLLDWGEDSDGDGIADASPLSHSTGWMLVDPERLDANADGIIDEGWSMVNGTLGAGDAMPTDPILTAISPNGVAMEADVLDTAVYVKGDRQDSAKLYDIQLEIEYVAEEFIGAVQQVVGLNHDLQTVTYHNGQVFDAPVVFATPPTKLGGQAASVAVTNVSNGTASLFLDEPDYLDGIHWKEEVSLLTLEEGTWSLADGTRMEVGTEIVSAGATDTFHSVTFGQAFDEVPTILVQLQTKNGADWAVVRTDDVTTTGFRFLIEEQEASDGLHAQEVLGWVAIDAGSGSGLIDWGQVMGQAFFLEDALDHRSGSVSLDPAFGDDALVSAVIASYNGPDTSMLRLLDISSDGSATTAEFQLQEEQSADSEVFHVQEDISGIVFDSAGLLQGIDTFDLIA